MYNSEENFERIKCGNCKDWKNKSCESACREECYLSFLEDQNKQLLDALKDSIQPTCLCDTYTGGLCSVNCRYRKGKDLIESITGKKLEK